MSARRFRTRLTRRGKLPIVSSALIVVRQNLVCLLNLGEAMEITPAILGGIGMMLAHEGSMGVADLLDGRFRRDIEDAVVVVFGHVDLPVDVSQRDGIAYDDVFSTCDGSHPMNDDIRQFGQNAIEVEAAAVRGIVLDEQFERAVRLILACVGSVLTTGIGKAGHVARKLSASFSSTGTPSHFLSPADALHGDLGSVRRGDVVVVLSSSGESDEILRLLSVLKKIGAPVIAVTSTSDNALGRFSDVVLRLGKIEEPCPLGLAPSASTTAMAALGDALFLTVMRERKFTAEDYALYHPAGQLGRKLIRVKEAMTFRLGENCPVASDRLTVGQVLHEVSRIKRRSGAVVLVDEVGKLSGIFSDGDLRRVITDNDGSALNRPIRDVMTRNPKRIGGEQLASEAIAIMRQHRIDDLPVVDELDRPIGIIDIQDLVVLRMLDVEP